MVLNLFARLNRKNRNLIIFLNFFFGWKNIETEKWLCNKIIFTIFYWRFIINLLKILWKIKFPTKNSCQNRILNKLIKKTFSTFFRKKTQKKFKNIRFEENIFFEKKSQKIIKNIYFQKKRIMEKGWWKYTFILKLFISIFFCFLFFFWNYTFFRTFLIIIFRGTVRLR